LRTCVGYKQEHVSRDDARSVVRFQESWQADRVEKGGQAAAQGAAVRRHFA
jgi:hypothetical protein